MSEPTTDIVSGYFEQGYVERRPHPDDVEGGILPCTECNGPCSVRAFRKYHGEVAEGFGAFTSAVVHTCEKCGHQQDI